MIDFLYDYLSAFQPQTNVDFTIFVVISMIFSALNIFLGYKLKRVWSTLMGAGIGFTTGFTLGGQIWQNSGAAFIAGIVLAVILGALAFFIYKAGIFLLCGALAFLLAYPILTPLFTDNTLALILSIAVGLIFGVIAIFLLRPFIIVTTAVGGSFSFSQSLFALFPAATQTTKLFGLSWPILLVGAVLSAIGIVVQFVTTKKHGKNA